MYPYSSPVSHLPFYPLQLSTFLDRAAAETGFLPWGSLSFFPGDPQQILPSPRPATSAAAAKILPSTGLCERHSQTT